MKKSFYFLSAVIFSQALISVHSDLCKFNASHKRSQLPSIHRANSTFQTSCLVLDNAESFFSDSDSSSTEVLHFDQEAFDSDSAGVDSELSLVHGFRSEGFVSEFYDHFNELKKVQLFYCENNFFLQLVLNYLCENKNNVSNKNLELIKKLVMNANESTAEYLAQKNRLLSQLGFSASQKCVVQARSCKPELFVKGWSNIELSQEDLFCNMQQASKKLQNSINDLLKNISQRINNDCLPSLHAK